MRRRITAAEDLAEDTVVKADRERKARLDAEIDAIHGEIVKLEIKNTELQNDIAQKEKQRGELRRKLRVSEQDKEKDRLSEALANRLRDYIALYKERKKKSLEGKILRALHRLMHKKNFIADVQVDILGEDIDVNLIAASSNGRRDVIRKESLSKGEQQLYATALLYGLVEESDIEFPVFIDSPMQKFDEEHAENIVRHFYPGLGGQVILFPLINKELTAREYDLLLPRVARTYLIVNHGPDHSGFEEVEPERLFATYAEVYN